MARFGFSVFCLALLAAAASHDVWHHQARAGAPLVIHMTLTDAALDPAVVVLPKGPVRFAVQNAGRGSRIFAVKGNGILAETPDLSPGDSAILEVTFTRPGTYALLAGRPENNLMSSSLTITP